MAKKETVTYNGKKYTVLEKGNGRILLTDGLIHFWVREENVKAE